MLIIFIFSTHTKPSLSGVATYTLWNIEKSLYFLKYACLYGVMLNLKNRFETYDNLSKKDDYEAISQLNITPQPDCLIRVMMLFTPLEDAISLTPQTLPTPAQRKGFVAVEWGGVQGDFFTTDLLSGK